MTIEQTVEIPADHRLIIEVPSEIPAGLAILTVTPAYSHISENDPCIVEEAIRMVEKRAAHPDRKPISLYFGILSPETYGDAVAYQRKLRDEWNN